MKAYADRNNITMRELFEKSVRYFMDNHGPVEGRSELLKVEEVAAIIGETPATVRTLVRTGVLDSVRNARRLYIKPESVDRFMEHKNQ